jgi:predicted PhzF superfamily epimerase YddE/YHI9
MDKFKMLSLANELGSSQTVYVLLHDQAAYLLRFFSQTHELPLGVHSCHAAAHLIYELGFSPPDDPLIFLTQEREVSASRVQSDQTKIKLTTHPINKMDQNNVNLYCDILGLNPKTVVWSAMTQNRQAIIAVDNTIQLRRLTPDATKLLNSGAMVLAVTSQDHGGSDYCLRCFASNLLNPEHQASGGIHRYLAPQWGRLLQKTRLQAKQLSHRGGLVQLDLSEPDFLIITAKSQTVLRADLVFEFTDEHASTPR